MTKDRFIGCLLGCAVGDALGMPVEGWPKERIQTRLGKLTDYLDPVILYDEGGKRLVEDEFGPIHNWTSLILKKLPARPSAAIILPQLGSEP